MVRCAKTPLDFVDGDLIVKWSHCIYLWLQARIQPRQSGATTSHDGETGDSLGGVEIGAGVLEMWCIERDGDREGKLEFDVR